MTLLLRFCQFSIKCRVYCSERTIGYWLLNLWIKDVNWIDITNRLMFQFNVIFSPCCGVHSFVEIVHRPQTRPFVSTKDSMIKPVKKIWMNKRYNNWILMTHFSFKKENVYEVSYIHTESLLRRYNWTKFLTIKSSPLQGLSIKWMLQGRNIKKEELIPIHNVKIRGNIMACTLYSAILGLWILDKNMPFLYLPYFHGQQPGLLVWPVC